MSTKKAGTGRNAAGGKGSAKEKEPVVLRLPKDGKIKRSDMRRAILEVREKRLLESR